MGTPVTLEVGDIAPLFIAEETNGETISLQSLLDDGKPVVLYFYPKDFTAGCTIEAKSFTELKSYFSKLNASKPKKNS